MIDAAAHSGGLDLLLGLEAAAGARWPDLRFGEGPVDGDDLRAALPATADGVALLSVARSTIDDPFELSGDALSTALDSLAGCQEPGLTVVDCPAELLEQCAEAVDHVVILAAAEVRAAAAAAKIVSRLSARRVDHSLVVRHRDWSGLSVADVEHIVGCDAVAELPTVRGLTKRVETVGLGGGIPRPLQRSGQLILAAAGWGQ